jgi:predicted DCC family thiol-disulfide oxidoreductase YuxK
MSSHPVVFYDGVCGLCDRSVQFILRHDRAGLFRFATLQSEFARRILEQHGRDPGDLDTMYMLHDQQLLANSVAVLGVLRGLGGAWAALSSILGVLPRAVRDRVYAVIVRNRYRWFGRADQCIVPAPETRDRFLDHGAPLA